jgi:membrane peptidoglycan carboxypeptidase
VRRTLTPDMAAEVTTVMEQVVERGTLAYFAQVEGYTIAGKTGTAERVENGRYSGSYNSTVVGFAPSRNPRFAVMVLVEAPTKGGYFGAPIAGPAFKRITEEALRAYGVPRDIEPTPPLLVARNGSSFDAEAVLASATSNVPRVIAASLRKGVMPDLYGMSAREAARTLASVGLQVMLRGNGSVLEQSIEAGETVERGAVCTLSLGRITAEMKRKRKGDRAETKVADASAVDDVVRQTGGGGDADKGPPYRRAEYRSLAQGGGGGDGDAERDPR